MSIGLLIITHDDIGASLLRAGITVNRGECPLRVETLPVPFDCDRDAVSRHAHELVDRLEEGDGVLVLTDLFGSTPGRIATELSEEGHVNVLAGVNLPMIVKVLNYARTDLPTVTRKAIEGARDCVMACCLPCDS